MAGLESRRNNRGKRKPGRPTTKVVTWSDIFADFKKTFPTISKSVPDFQPYSYATIKLYFVDGKRMLYNYDTKKLTHLE